MKKYATLLIKNLRHVYTMEEKEGKPYVLSKGYIAIHHDEILAIGRGGYQSFVDKDTRIVDACNHIAIPAFIEPDARFVMQKGSHVLELHAFLMRYMRHGTLTIQMREAIPQPFYKDYHFHVLKPQKKDFQLPVFYAIEQMHQDKLQLPTFPCLSCADEKVSLQNQMLAAQMLAMKEELEAYELLKMLTLYPAKALKLDHLGMLKKGMCANILVLSAKNIHAFFYSLDQDQIAQIIHKGVRIYPSLLV